MSINVGWAGPAFHPLHREHVVQLYRKEQELVSTVTGYTLAAFHEDHAVLFVATRHNCRQFRNELEARGVDVRSALDRGQLAFVTVEEVLLRILRDNQPDAVQFERLVRTLLARCRRDGRFRHVHIYGEIVNVLWQAGNSSATLRLEELWNELREVEPFTLYCGFHVDRSPADLLKGPMANVIHTHSKLIEPRPPASDDGAPRAAFVELADLKGGDATDLATAVQGLGPAGSPG
jgi:hypothetical protein